jgi:nicotinamide mononucleotide transporter
MTKVQEYFAELKGNYFKDWSSWEKIWTPLSTLIVVAASVTFWETNAPIWSALNLLATCTGMVCVALVSGKKISNWFWGIANTILFTIIYFSPYFYPNNSGAEYALLNLIYYLPLQFLGIYQWIKRKYSVDIVKPRTFGLKGWIITIFAISIILPALTLAQIFFIDKSEVFSWTAFLIATGTTTGLVAQIFMNMSMSQQWILWVLEDVAMLVFNLLGETPNIPMAIMFGVWLLNAVLGLWNWFRNIKAKDI